MNKLFICDYERAYPVKYRAGTCFLRLLKHHELRFMFWGRVEQTSSSKICKRFVKMILHKYRRKYGLEINFNNVGEGLRLIHPWNITMNANAVLGSNVTLYKGCTIGEITEGRRKGNPVIENGVIVYANSKTTFLSHLLLGKSTAFGLCKTRAIYPFPMSKTR